MTWIADAGVVKVAQQTCEHHKCSSDCIITFNHFLKIIICVCSVSAAAAESLTRAPVRTLAEEGGHAIVAGGPMVTSCTGAVIDVLTAVVARPPVDAHAVVAAVSVVARSSVLACVGHQLTLVHIFSAVLT